MKAKKEKEENRPFAILLFLNQVPTEAKLELKYAPMKLCNISIERADSMKLRKDLFHEKQFLLVGGSDCRIHLYRLKMSVTGTEQIESLLASP